MLNLICDSRLEALRTVSDAQTKALLDALVERTMRNTAENRLVQKNDTQEWWHLVWERMSDAAFVYALNGGDVLGRWVHDRTMEIVSLDADEWIGPWFRKRVDPPCGNLETAHVVNAVVHALCLCPSLFGNAEKNAVLTAIREKGLDQCERFMERKTRSNWSCVLAGGFASAAAVLDDRDAVERAVGYYNDCLDLYNSDGYGETLQYGNYASLSLVHMRRVLLAYDPSLAPRLSIGPIAAATKLGVMNFIGMKPLEEGGKAYPRSVNFGDSAAIYRPTGDVAITVASEASDPVVCGLARWHFDTTYADPTLGPDELATFGFFNQFTWMTVADLEKADRAITPEAAGLPLRYVSKLGPAVIRDGFGEGTTLLGVQSGGEVLKVSGHRHTDMNSFVLAHLGERFFADPGHCCYRLETWRQSRMAMMHNTWTFLDEEGHTLSQAGAAVGKEPLAHEVTASFEGEGFEVFSTDAAKAYGEHFKRAERTFIAAFPHVLFIVDRIETDVPMKVVSHFVVNNRDNKLDVHIADDKRLVFRRDPAAIKFFTFGDVTFSKRYGFIHDHYHPLPNQEGQGREGSAMIYDYTSAEFSTSHLIVHAVAMAEIGEIRKWHIKPGDEGVYNVFSPKNELCWRLTVDGEKLKGEFIG